MVVCDVYVSQPDAHGRCIDWRRLVVSDSSFAAIRSATSGKLRDVHGASRDPGRGTSASRISQQRRGVLHDLLHCRHVRSSHGVPGRSRHRPQNRFAALRFLFAFFLLSVCLQCRVTKIVYESKKPPLSPMALRHRGTSVCGHDGKMAVCHSGNVAQ